MADYKAGSLSVEFFGIDKSLSGTLDNIIKRLEKLENITKGIGTAGRKNRQRNDGFFSFSNFARMGTFIASMRRVARIGQQILQYGVNYTETLNLWQVAMGNNISMAREFVTEMNKAYGISEKTLMNAQAIFKNMIGSLGQVSETTAYALSEAITQMAVDYASLYNVSIDSAITKFQAALAGQVRPIRSVSGYDITENTLYQLYQQLGGTKTMRQLTRTEKQLLSIYAVFKQMDASGALGDMEKTIDQVANQSRMMAENWETVATWAGISFQYILQETGAFKTINAVLITMGEVLKSIAFSLGYETPDFALDWADNVEDTNKEIDKLQGKLLGFDKFRALNEGENNALGIDQKLLEAISGYTSQIDTSINKARELADTWLTNLGFVDENGDGVYDITQKAEELLNTVKNVALWFGIAFGLSTLSNISAFIQKITKLGTGVSFLSSVLLTGAIFALVKFIEAIKNGDVWSAILAGTITVVLASAFIFFNKKVLLDTYKNIIGKIIPAFGSMKAAIASVTSSLMIGSLVFAGALSILRLLPEDARKTVGSIMLIVGAIGALITAMLALNTTISWGTALPILSAGIGLAIAGGMAITNQIKDVAKYANGGMPDKGTMFIAGEAGAEMVYNTPSGQSGVANIQQIQQAMYGALVAYGRTQSGSNGQPIVVQIDGEKVFQATQKSAKKHGYAFAKV